MSELRIVQARVSLQPPTVTTDQPDLQTVQALVFEPLVRWRDGRLLPGLAESWRLTADGRGLLVRLREDAAFHDGSAVTVEDVVAAIETLRSGRDDFGMAGAYAPYLTPLQLKPQSERELLLEGPGPSADLPEIRAAVAPGKRDGAGGWLGAGPYRVEESDRDRVRLSLVRKEARSPGRGACRTVVFTALPEPEERLAALRGGSADVATGLEELVDGEADAGGGDLIWPRCTNTLSVTAFLNGSIPPFDRPEARLAVNLAVDVDRIVREVWGGLAERSATVVSPWHFGYPPRLAPQPHDPERAARLFEGVPMPDELVIRTPLVTPERAVAVAKAIARDLAAIGIRVRIERQPDRPLYAREVGLRQIGHMALFDSSPLSTHRVLWEKVSGEARGRWWQGVSDGEADRLIAATRAATEPSERLAAYRACLRWLRNQPHWLYLYHPVRVYACRRDAPPVGMNHGGFLELPGMRRIDMRRIDMRRIDMRPG